jgi:hypothetical protein
MVLFYDDAMKALFRTLSDTSPGNENRKIDDRREDWEYHSSLKRDDGNSVVTDVCLFNVHNLKPNGTGHLIFNTILRDGGPVRPDGILASVGSTVNLTTRWKEDLGSNDVVERVKLLHESEYALKDFINKKEYDLRKLLGKDSYELFDYEPVTDGTYVKLFLPRLNWSCVYEPHGQDFIFKYKPLNNDSNPGLWAHATRGWMPDLERLLDTRENTYSRAIGHLSKYNAPLPRV